MGLLAHLDPARQRELLDDLNYLNLGELHTFCRHHAIPYRVLAAKPDGGTTTTPDNDRKPVILRRVRHYLTTSTVPAPTCLPAEIVRSGPPAVLRPADRLYYRWYNKTYRQVIGLLAELTDGRFRNGALARVLIMEFWTSGEAPTFTRFAEAWSKATDEGRDLLTPEYAFLTDLHHGRATPEWKAMRQQKADAVLATLAKIERPIRPA